VLYEVHLWSKLEHRNILPLIGITTSFDSTVSIVSKWIASGNARDYVQDKAVDPRPLLAGIARGLVYLHNHELGPIIHGDLKGLNVLISDDGHALLMDFGVSYLVNSTFSLGVRPLSGGTLNWMAPELQSECSPTMSADVWSFGMTVLVCGMHMLLRPVHLKAPRSCSPETIHITKSRTQRYLFSE
ncbi:hypothetical protein ID866_8899, partial [Astraeus odoratus]